MMLLCIKQHLSNIWSSIHEKVKQHWAWVEKSVAYKKKLVLKSSRIMTPEFVDLKNQFVLIPNIHGHF